MFSILYWHHKCEQRMIVTGLKRDIVRFSLQQHRSLSRSAPWRVTMLPTRGMSFIKQALHSLPGLVIESQYVIAGAAGQEPKPGTTDCGFEMPLSNKRNLHSLEKWLILGPG